MQEVVGEHDRLFREALATVKGEISLRGQPEMAVPGWLLARKLKHGVTLFERTLKINPGNWSAMWFIGKVHQRFRNNDEALSWFERSYRINPSHPDIAREASLSAMETGRHDAAIAFACRAAEIEPSNPGLHANLALAYLLAGRILEAETAIDRALTIDPSDKVSQTIRSMVWHFSANGLSPPTKTPDLLNYWRQNRNAG